MMELFVDPAGMDGLYNLLAGAGSDARQVRAYAGDECRMESFDIGLLQFLSGPHRHAYETITGGLDRLTELSRDAATQVNRAQVNYARTDVDSAAQLDRTYPGAEDPSGLRGTLVQPRPDLAPARPPFADIADVPARLVPPNYATDITQFQFNLVTDLLSPSAWIRQVALWLFNFDPFDGWLRSIGGDWERYQHLAAAWPIVGKAAGDIGRNLISGAADVSTVWQGNAAEAEQEYQLKLGVAAMALETICMEYAPLYIKASEAAIQLFSSVGGMVSALIDVIIIINAAGAIGAATAETIGGPIAAAAIIAYYSWQAFDLYKETAAAFQTAEIIIRGVAAAILAVQAHGDIQTLPTLSPYQHPANSGRSTP